MHQGDPMAGQQAALALDLASDIAVAADEPRRRDDFDRGPSLKLIEQDLAQAHTTATRASLETRRSSESQINDARQATELANSVGAVASNVAQSAEEMAATLHAIRDAAGAITKHVAAANAATIAATDKTGKAETSVAELTRVAEEIAGVIELVSHIAQQTTMLSHNANIQAARAGEAGRGFAVIAQEVRKLSEETRTATDRVQKQISALRHATTSCKTSVAQVADAVKSTAALYGSIESSARSQLESVEQLSTAANASAGDAQALSQQSAELLDVANASLESAQRIAEQSSKTDDALGKLHDNLFILLSQTRSHDADDIDVRQPLLLRCALNLGGRAYAGETIEFGIDGAVLRLPGATEALEGQRGTCQINGVGALEAQVLRIDKIGAHVHFQRPGDAIMTAARRTVREANEKDRPFIARAVDGALAISLAMEAAIEARTLTEAQLFDTAYKKVTGSDPVQFTNAALHALEKILTPIQEEILATDSKLAFCAAVDLNGYLPVHNKKYSHPQKPGDPAWNMANCRNRRIFADRAGLAAARNAKPHLVQFYARDMGGGKFVMMKEIDAPIVVHGRHWGGFRTSYTI